MPSNLLSAAGRIGVGAFVAGAALLAVDAGPGAAKRSPAPVRHAPVSARHAPVSVRHTPASAGHAPASATHTTAAAAATGTLQITGAGFGHGIGMSQYGALGFAEHGWSAAAILGHYYAGTTLAHVPDATVTVLLHDGVATVRGIGSAGSKQLDPSRSYEVLPTRDGNLQLLSGGRTLGPFAAPLKLSPASATAGFELVGRGSYAGSLLAYPSGSGRVLAVNAVGLEDYVRGVVSKESPSSWPAAALQAQAVAARTYVLADTPVSPDYDVYADTRSQMYGGIGAETTATDAAEAATRGEVVEAGGHIIPTYFSASSGGHTEDIQNVWVGVSPAAYLVGVSDPYDAAGANPYYRWSDSMRLSTAASRLRGLFRGDLEGIRVLQRGVSPRVVSAQVVGTGGSTTVSGQTLEADLGTYSTWMSFTTVTATGASTPAGSTPAGPSTTTTSASAAPTTTTTSTTSTTGGSGLHGDLARAARRVTGTVFPARPGASVTVELRTPDGWSRVGTAQVGRDGRYALAVFTPGRYRAVYAGAAAPATLVR